MRRVAAGFAAKMEPLGTAAPVAGWAAKAVLSLLTFLFLASIGGAMVFAWPVLVPLHWWAARRSGPAGVVWFALLAGLSLAEVAAIATLAAAGDGAHVAVVLVGVLVAAAWAFLRGQVRRRGAAAAA